MAFSNVRLCCRWSAGNLSEITELLRLAARLGENMLYGYLWGRKSIRKSISMEASCRLCGHPKALLGGPEAIQAPACDNEVRGGAA